MKRHSGSLTIIPAMELTEGAGVTVHRTIGTPAMRHLDPFMLLDHISSNDPDEYIAGFPSHPHRGFNTFTYMIDGHMEHKDSMGNTGKLGPGDAQWMKAASGVIHSEMPQQEHGLLRGFQLWINLPAVNKMEAPEYQEYNAKAFPVVDEGDYRVKVIVGHYGEISSPIIDDLTKVTYLDLQINSNGVFNYPLATGNNSMLYLFEGTATVNGTHVDTHSLVVFDKDVDKIEIKAESSAARLLLMSGSPINESVVQYGPFVMNTRDEIDQAMHDFRTNNFVRDRAWVNRNKQKGETT